MAYFKIKHMSHGSGVAPVVGTDTFPTSGTKHITVGFKPAYLVLTRANASPQTTMMEIYSKDYSTTKYRMASSSAYAQDKNFNATNNALIYSIDNDGFTVNKDSSANSFQYFAIPESYSGNVVVGDVNWRTSGTTSVNVGFKPKYLAITKKPTAPTDGVMLIYSEDYSTTVHRAADESFNKAKDNNFNTTGTGRIYSIDDNGFTVTKGARNNTMQYIVLG